MEKQAEREGRKKKAAAFMLGQRHGLCTESLKAQYAHALSHCCHTVLDKSKPRKIGFIWLTSIMAGKLWCWESDSWSHVHPESVQQREMRADDQLAFSFPAFKMFYYVQLYESM